MTADLAIAILFFILGLIPAYYFYKKSLRLKEPIYSIKSYNLFSGSNSTIEKLKISYDNRKVSDLTVSKILFCNQGADTISRNDIDTIKHIAITVNNNDNKILDAKVLQTNNLSSQFTLDFNKKENKVIINFDYLDKSQGAVIQVIHTGLSSEDLQITGDIKSVSKIKRIFPVGEASDLPFETFDQTQILMDLGVFISKNERLSFLARVLYLIFIVMGVVSILSGIFFDKFNNFLSSLGIPEVNKDVLPIFFAISITLALFSTMIMIIVSGRKQFPSDLEKFLE